MGEQARVGSLEQEIEFERWLANCCEDAKQKLNLAPLQIIFRLADAIVKEVAEAADQGGLRTK